MQMRTTEHVAFGVPNVDEAVQYYGEAFGFKETDRQKDWVELSTGVLKIYLAPEDGHSPCLNVLVPSVPDAEEQIVKSGGSVYMRLGKEVLVQDKYGHCFCLTPEG